MANRVVAVYGRKILSLTLIFNALMSSVFAIQLLAGYYTANWKLYTPYLLDGSLFWAIILASMINLFPAADIGRVKTGRLWFHHYIYGFAVSISSTGLALVLTPVSIISLFIANNTDVTVNTARFFIVGGMTLVVDDLPDISKRINSAISFVKSEVYKRRRIMHIVQCLAGFVSFYFFLAVSLYVASNPEWATLANFILIGTLLVTSLTSFMSVKRKTWLNMMPAQAGSS